MKTISCLVVLMLAVSCANAKPPPSEEQKKLNTTSQLQSPVKVTWEEVSRGEGEAVVLAKIERVLKIDMPFLVQVQVPEGVTVKQGRERLELLPNNEAVLITERFVFAYAAPPKEDAHLKLDGDGAGMGFHYDVPYRFGRSAPVDVDPAATGPSAEIGGKKLGPSVPLK